MGGLFGLCLVVAICIFFPQVLYIVLVAGVLWLAVVAWPLSLLLIGLLFMGVLM